MSTDNLYTPLCIRTYSGIYLNVVQMKATDVFPIDIAYGLARECRFGNHTKRFYSVAEHSVWCMNKAKELYPYDFTLHLMMLLHDAHEAYLGDWCTPMVDAMDEYAPGFKDSINTIKRLVQAPINQRFGLALRNTFDDPRVKEIDRLALEWEWKNKVISWKGMPEIEEDVAAEVWLNYFKELVKVPVVVE